MAIRPDYDIGTVTLVASSANFTTTGASLQTAAVQAGDAIITPSGHVLIIASVTGQNTGTLFLPCPAGAAGTDLPLRIRFQPDGSRYQGAVRNLVDLLSSGNVEAFAALVGAAGLVPMFTGPGTMDLVDPATFGVPDPEGRLSQLSALGAEPNRVLATDDDGDFTYFDGQPILIFATGQSNIGMHNAHSWSPPKNLFLWDWDGMDVSPSGTKFEPMPNDTMGVSYSFAAEVAKRNPLSKVYVVNIGIGSLPIANWLPGAGAPDMYALGKTNVQAALSAIGSTPHLIHLWWQGENDALASSTTYAANFITYRNRIEAEAWFPVTTKTIIMGVSFYVTVSDANTKLQNFSVQLTEAAAKKPDVLTYVHTSSIGSDFWTVDDGANKIHMTGAGYELAGKLAYENHTNGRRALSVDTYNDPRTGAFLTRKPAFMARSSTPFSTVGALVPWNVVDYNVGGYYVAGQNWFQAPVKGLYQFSYSLVNKAAGGALAASLVNNGTKVAGSATLTTVGYETVFNSVPVFMNNGQVIGLVLDDGGTIGDANMNMFCGYLIG